MKKIHSYSRAFTLIELLVVISIIGILSGIILANFSAARAKTRDGKRISDLGNIQLALELFYDRCRTYPSAVSGTPKVNIESTCTPNSVTIHLTDYISKLPDPPNGFNSITYYKYYTDGNDYVLSTQLERDNEAMKEGAIFNTKLGATCTTMGGIGGEYHYCVSSR